MTTAHITAAKRDRVRRLAGTTRPVRVLSSTTHRVGGRGERIQVVEELAADGKPRRQEHVLTDQQCDPTARKYDEGTIRFIADDDTPDGGYWKLWKNV